ncbi:Eclosion hormone [Amphibalanus amphitrite]|uniref:Eclosion hormone n=1 Tax=Amphibalanus amphitrite TaxID=1232801 RepID=A0A6A4WV15_AMPAM|nr:Eclosion hormone [Amphibalanus amphitrite]
MDSFYKFRSNLSSTLVLLCSVLVCLLLTRPADANIGSCVRNCGQCKSMYGRFFQGTACADACLAGNESPDCVNPSMVSRFMKRRWSPAAASEVPLSGKYEYYNVDGQPVEVPLPSGPALFKMLSAGGTEARK